LGQRALSIGAGAWVDSVIRRWLLTLALALALALPGAAGAHEFWVQPAQFRLAQNTELAVGLRVGTAWPGQPVPRDPDRFERFAALDALGERPVPSGASFEDAGLVRMRVAGSTLLVYRSRPLALTLSAVEFENYLREVGLDTVLAERAARGARQRAGREIYSRCAKAIVAVGGDESGFERLAGLPLELQLLSAPSSIRGGAPLRLRLWYRGKPLPRALVQAWPRGAPDPPLQARTGASGEVVLPARPGTWLVSAVHMVPAAVAEADWESLWASLAVELP
jgi:hypothetical protein